MYTCILKIESIVKSGFVTTVILDWENFENTLR